MGVSETARRILASGIVFALPAVAHQATAQAPTGGPPPRLILQALDTDHDGKLSAAEITNASSSLRTLDRNRDGQLTLDELQPRPQNAGASADDLVRQLMSFDRNGDGVLTPDELPARMQNLFQRGDANQDGKLTQEEIRAMTAHQGMPAGTRVEPGHAAGSMRLDPLLNALDTNHDGLISADEIASATLSLRALDLNGDHEITPDEMRVRQQTPAERTDHLLDEWDSNKDGKISREEAPDRLQQQFDSVDKNGDGFLDREELMQFFTSTASGQKGGNPPSANQPAAAPQKENRQ